MKGKHVQPSGPSASELRLRSELDRLRREVSLLRKQVDGPPHSKPAPAAAAAPEASAPAGAPGTPDAPPALIEPAAAGTPGAAIAPPAPAATGASAAPANGAAPADEEMHRLRTQVAELTAAKQRLSRLYFSQLEENRRRQHKLQLVLETVRDINTELDIDVLVQRLVDGIRGNLAFGMVVARVREPGSDALVVRGTAGLDDSARAEVETRRLRVGELLADLRDEFRVGRSYFIPASRRGSQPGIEPNGPIDRPEPEWSEGDVLHVPLFVRNGEMGLCLTLRDPADGLVPSLEVVELLEIYGNHATAAIENARLYRQLEARSREVEDSGRLHSEMQQLKSHFVSTVSHELRTPLTAIRAYLDTLLVAQEGEISHVQLQHFLAVMSEESQRLSRLIESVLDLNRCESGVAHMSRQPVDLLEIAHETARILEPVAQVGQVNLKVIAECEDTRLTANRDQMRQLALHLTGNAVKFTPVGGEVTLRVSGDNGQLAFEVVDTGIGIPAHSLERIFERFYQVDSSLSRRYGGTGLGLAICKSIVDWHGGRIGAESAPGKGSRFIARLPRQVGPRVVVRSSPRREAAAEDVLRLAIEMVAEVMGARVVSLMCPEDNGDLVIRAAMGLDENVIAEARIRPGSGVAGWVAANRRPVCVSGSEERVEVSVSGRELYRSRTFLSVPIENNGELLGVLNVTDPISQSQFDSEDCHLLLQLAERVAVAWRQTLAAEEQQAGVVDTANALRQVLQHLEDGRRLAPDRVRLARSLARLLALQESEVGVISFAASVHDIGMTRLGDRLREGAGELTAEDREALHQHPEAGASLLEPLERVGVVREVVLSHHEWWDGTGYPRGLKGEDIPIGGRILAVVDAYESMTIGRPHRPPLARREALMELHRLAGRQFDPRVVDVFARALDEAERTTGEDDPARATAAPAAQRG